MSNLAFQTTKLFLYLAKIAGENVEIPKDQEERWELYLAKIAGEDVKLPDEIRDREELFLAKWAGVLVNLPEDAPASRIEHYLMYIIGDSRTKPSEPHNELEVWLDAIAETAIPVGWKRALFIESTGAQYILTSVTDVRNSTFYIDFQMTETPSSGFPTIWGAMPTANDYKVVFGSGNQKLYNQLGNGTGYVNTIDKDLNRHKVTINTDRDVITVNIDGQEFSAEYSVTEDTHYELAMFARNKYDGIGNYAKLRLFEAWHRNKVTDEIDCHLIPIYNDREYAVFDTVSRDILRNLGTGDFTGGINYFDPDAPYAIQQGFVNATGGWSGLEGFYSFMTLLTEGNSYIVERLASHNCALRIAGEESSTPSNTAGKYELIYAGASGETTYTFTVPRGFPYVLVYVKHSAGTETLEELIEAFAIYDA